MLIKQGTNWLTIKEMCQEHLRVKLAGRSKRLGVACLWTCRDSRTEKEQLVNCLRRDICDLSISAEVMLVGDLNAHIDDLKEAMEYNGALVLD